MRELDLVALRVLDYDHPDAKRLVAAAQLVYIERYGDEDLARVDASEFAAPRGLFLVGYVGGQPVVSGGWRLRSGRDDPELRGGDAEIKRMYVTDQMRGRGLARRMLAELERTAAEAGAHRMVLETGWRQPEAIALYRSSGYTPIRPFGRYRDHPGCRCFAKPLE